MKRLATLTLASVLLSSTALADHLVTHNGSLMNVSQDRQTGIVRIAYMDPRASLRAIGIQPGTLLVEGHWTAPNVFEGHAAVFACGIAWTYQVTGGLDSSNVLLLDGPAPLIVSTPYGECGLSGYGWGSTNAHLAFIPYAPTGADVCPTEHQTGDRYQAECRRHH